MSGVCCDCGKSREQGASCKCCGSYREEVNPGVPGYYRLTLDGVKPDPVRVEELIEKFKEIQKRVVRTGPNSWTILPEQYEFDF